MKFWEGSIVFAAGAIFGAGLAVYGIAKMAKKDEGVRAAVEACFTRKLRGIAAKAVCDILKPEAG